MMFLVTVIVEPWVGKRIEIAFNETSDDYLLQIDKVHISILKSGIELENISLFSKQEQDGIPNLNGEIASVNLKGIKLLKVLFKNDYDIREVCIFNSRFTGKAPFQENAKPPKVSLLNIRIDSLFFDKLVVEIKSISTAQTYSIKDGVLKIYDFLVEKQDTISPDIIKQFDFDVEELLTISADSMYTITAVGANYSASSNTLVIDSFSVHPNYSDYEFTARHQFETDRIETGASRISVYGFSAVDYLKTGNCISSFIEIGELDVNVFRDKRKEFRHEKKPAFQELIYNYPGIINIDSIGILSGNIIYTEHAEKANEPGVICFNQMNARIYRITNDTIYKAKEAFLELKAEALFMGNAKTIVLLKGRLFDKQNTFTVNGSLSGMDVKELNPILENNAFVYATSGKIDAMNFSFTANNTHASGHMNLLYHGLDLAVKNKRTDDTTAMKEQVKSVIANMKVYDSNPLPGEAARVGAIEYQRDPEKFIFIYCAKSILSGIKSSIVKSPKKSK